MVDVNRALVDHVARLSRLELPGAEAEQYVSQLRQIIGYVEKLSALDVSQVEPMVHALESVNVFREDEVRPSMPIADVLANAPARVERFFKVPKVIED